MSDITASERRLSAALDRLDHLLEVAPPRPASDDGAVQDLTRQLQEQQARNADLQRQLDDLRHRSDDDGGLQARLDQAAEQVARMAAANEDLITANRDLLDAHATGGIGPDEGRAALEAEIAALRAARAAEMAQMSEIMTELERLLADDGTGAPLALDDQHGDATPTDKEQ